MQTPRQPLRLLLVEDSPDDADLILLELSEGGFDVACERVETAQAMRAALAGGNRDVVISDFSLPRFGAREALAVLRETDVDIPFIVVSGCIGEENAIALMKEGAGDFVMKDRLARLAPVIGRELQDATARRERRQALEALCESEKLLKEITISLGEGVLVMGNDGNLVFMNPEAERLLGWRQSELLGKNVHRAIHSKRQDGTPLPESACEVLEVLKSGRMCQTEDEIFWRKDGSFMPVSIMANAIVEEGKVVASVIAFQDISQRKQAEQDLQESRCQLRALSAHLQTVREEERTRIARELHDELGQMLTGVKLDAMWLAANLSDEKPAVTDKVASMSKLIDETLDAMRRVAADLRPVMLDDLGLVAAVEWLTEEFGKRTGIHIGLEVDVEGGQCNCDGGENDLSAEVATAAFRIVQECLTNIARHAEAENVQVLLECTDDKIVLRVTDDGKGIPAVSNDRRKSYGLIGMRERAANLGGTLDFSSAPGEGARVEAILPTRQPVFQERRNDPNTDRR